MPSSTFPNTSSKLSLAKPRGLKNAVSVTLDKKSADDLLAVVLDKKKPASIVVNKNKPVLRFGLLSKELVPATQRGQGSELFGRRSSSVNSNAVERSAVVRHAFVPKDAATSAGEPDLALMRLEMSMHQNKFQREARLAKTSQWVPNQDPTAARKRARYLASKQRSKLQKIVSSRGSVSPSKLSKSHATHAKSGLTASATPAIALTPRSHPGSSLDVVVDPKKDKIVALRRPLLHLLALYPHSTAVWLAEKLNTKEELVSGILLKAARPSRTGVGKFELADKSFKELDVWSFPYPGGDDDRKKIQEVAISAFDRMRISPSDKLWQLLLPRDQRGKGIILSRLNLHHGPISSASTPVIAVQRPSGDDSTSDGSSSCRSASTASDMKKKALSEREARLFGKRQKKAAVSKPKTKVMEKKTNAKTNTKVKSEEFIEDSDEELPDADATSHVADKDKFDDTHVTKPPKAAVESLTKPIAKHASEQSLAEGRTAKTTKPAKSAKSAKPAKPAKVTKTTKSMKPPKLLKSSSASAGTARTPSLEKSTATSTVKSTMHVTKNVATSKRVKAAAKPRAVSSLSKPASSHSPSSTSSVGKKAGSSNSMATSSPANASKQATVKSVPSKVGSAGHRRTPSNASSEGSIKRKASEEMPTPSKRHRTSESLVRTKSQTSPRIKDGRVSTLTSTLKRKAEESEPTKANFHHSNNSNSKPALPAKRHQASPATSSSLSELSSLSTDSENGSPLTKLDLITQAQRFHHYWNRYTVVYHKVYNAKNPSKEEIDRVLKMHNRLAAMKEEIKKGAELIGLKD